MWHRALVGTVVVTLVCAACGSNKSTGSAEQFGAQLVAWVGAGDYGAVYDSLYPGQQHAITRERYVTCLGTFARATKRLGYDFKSARLVRVNVGKEMSISIPGTRDRVRATPIRARVSLLVRGKRTLLPASDTPEYVVRVRNRWRYLDMLVDEYLKPMCSASSKEVLGSEQLAKVPDWARAEHFTGNSTAIAGAKLFAVSGCLNCHRYDASGGGFRAAPDLTAEGAKHKGIAFQITHLQCPACVNAGSPMPAFAGLGEANLRKLAAFLEASKGRR